MASATNLKSQIVTSSASLIERAILLVRGHRVMLDSDLADLYQVPVKRPNQQVAQSGPLSGGLHVPAFCGGARHLKVANCDLKIAPRHTPEVRALRFHRARRGNALQRPPQSASRPGQHRNHARVRAAARDASDQQGPRPEADGAQDLMRAVIASYSVGSASAKPALGARSNPLPPLPTPFGPHPEPIPPNLRVCTKPKPA